MNARPTFAAIERASVEGRLRPVLHSADELIRQDTHRAVAMLEGALGRTRLTGEDEQRRIGIQLRDSMKTQQEFFARHLARKQRRGW